jgi:thiamine-monophosphate kinase
MVERIRRTLGSGSEDPGLRDDAAVVSMPADAGSMVVSVDSVVEGVHFDLALSSLHDVGWKALMSALSDVAAMGAAPLGALVALCVPGLEQGDSAALGVMEGVAAAAAASGCPVMGGDVSAASQLVVVVTVWGALGAATAVRRSGAQPGDVLVVTGPCGGSAAGLRQLRTGRVEGAGAASGVARHLRPVALVAQGLAASRVGVHAMIDVSDGLALDLHRLADASGIGFELDRVPVADGATLPEALGGGEDYELVMAVGPDDLAALVSAFEAAGLPEPVRLGLATGTTESRLLCGAPLGRLGWQHGDGSPVG